MCLLTAVYAAEADKSPAMLLSDIYAKGYPEIYDNMGGIIRKELNYLFDTDDMVFVWTNRFNLAGEMLWDTVEGVITDLWDNHEMTSKQIQDHITAMLGDPSIAVIEYLEMEDKFRTS